jgi:hypothetical protein
MFNRRAVSAVIGMAAMFGACFSLYAGDTLTTWQYNTTITLNTSATGAKTTSTQYNFPVLIRLTSANAATVFATARSDGGDLRFTRPGAGDTSQLPYELNKYSAAQKTAIIWVKVDSLVGNNANQTINMYWGKSSATTTSDSTKVFAPANGFGMVLHLNKLASSTTLYDATGQGNNGTPSGTVTDTTGVFDRAVAVHCYGTSSSYVAGDSITIASLIGQPANVTMSAWVRVDSIDQANTSGNGHLGCIMSMGDYASMNDAGGSGTGTDSLCTGWFGTGTQWNNYGWPTQSETGTSLNGFSNTSGYACLHQGWRHVAIVINPTVGYANIYYNGDSVATEPAANALAWTGGNSGVRTVLGKHGGGHAGLKLGGSICEARIDTVARASDWLRLCYQNQQPNDSLTSVSAASSSGVPALRLPANGATGQPVSESFSWSAATGATSYQLQVSINTAFTTTLFSQAGITALTQTVAGLAVNATYYWHVNAAGTSSNAWAATWSFTTSPVPATPVLSSPSNGATGQKLSLSLSWGSASGATSYALLVSTVSTFATTVQSQVGLTNTTFALSGLSTKTTYFWQVESINNVSHMWASAWSFTTVATGVLVSSENTVLKTDFGVRGNALLYSVASPGAVEITFSDLLGRVALVVNRNMAAGNYTLGLRNLSLAPGSYIVRFKTGGIERIKTVMLER